MTAYSTRCPDSSIENHLVFFILYVPQRKTFETEQLTILFMLYCTLNLEVIQDVHQVVGILFTVDNALSKCRDIWNGLLGGLTWLSHLHKSTWELISWVLVPGVVRNASGAGPREGGCYMYIRYVATPKVQFCTVSKQTRSLQCFFK